MRWLKAAMRTFNQIPFWLVEGQIRLKWSHLCLLKTATLSMKQSLTSLLRFLKWSWWRRGKRNSGDSIGLSIFQVLILIRQLQGTIILDRWAFNSRRRRRITRASSTLRNFWSSWSPAVMKSHQAHARLRLSYSTKSSKLILDSFESWVVWI